MCTTYVDYDNRLLEGVLASSNLIHGRSKIIDSPIPTHLN